MQAGYERSFGLGSHWTSISTPPNTKLYGVGRPSRLAELGTRTSPGSLLSLSSTTGLHVQGYLAYKKSHHPRILPWIFAQDVRGVLGRWAFSCEPREVPGKWAFFSRWLDGFYSNNDAALHMARPASPSLLEVLYRGPSPMRKRLPSWDPPKTLGIGLQ
jgi:hypothetical protein